jgi:hypothetical protein
MSRAAPKKTQPGSSIFSTIWLSLYPLFRLDILLATTANAPASTIFAIGLLSTPFWPKTNCIKFGFWLIY